MIKVLIVDDEYTIRKGLEKTVPWQKYGYSVEYTAKNGLDALDYFKENYADIVISDIKMPLMDGLELQKKLHSKYPELPFIFISGYEDFKYAKEAMKYGAFSYILKPIDIDELLTEVNRAREEYNLDSYNVPLKNIIERNFFDFDKAWNFSNYEYLCNDCENNYFCVVTIRCRHDDMKSNIFLLAFQSKIQEIMNKCFPKKNYVLIEASSRGIVFCIMNSDDKILKYNIAKVVNLMSEKLGESFALPFGVWTGGIYKGISKLIDSYFESFNNDTFRFSNNIESNELGFHDTFDFDVYNSLFSNEDKIIRMLFEGNTDEAKKELTKQKNNIIENHLSIEDARLLLRNVFYKFIDGIKKSGQILELPHKLNSYGFLSFSTFDDMFEKTFEMLDEVVTLIKPLHYNQTNKSMEDVKSYIKEHYSDPYLSLTSIADYVNLNPSYISTEFAKYEGECLTNYIANIRINRAKYLLLNSAFKITDISNSIGYINQTYFSTVFRRFTGSTPSEFRKKRLE
ncbi:response regulator transcription factor [Clostridium grantii]|uniref:Stage 0 sporulation protein A homolog n=1 Tax=Clostridium grantii DSM 8605 TaxID=1121316 RepID=A0A1M5V656_9CLOT|nr:response regulator [Clostridium grantii]SHH70691.1 Two-component response regulator, YesN/AraC family, consists of REC and AraC-type DNA-binding domains [Clostridium grantii DSM 8605]